MGFTENNVELIKIDPSAKKTVRRNARIQNTDNPFDALGKGDEASVRRVTVSLSERAYPGLAFKEYKSEHAAMHAFKVYGRLKSLGIPVPSIFRLVKEGEKYTGILMTDLTREWNDILITSNNGSKRNVLEKVKAINPNTLSRFTQVDLNDQLIAVPLSEKLKKIATQATHAKIRFESGDTIAAVFTHQGELLPIISDMGNIQLDVADPDEQLLAENLHVVTFANIWINEAQRIAKELQ